MSRRTDDIVQRVESLPGVESAFASNFVPLSGGGGYSGVATDLITPEPGREQGTTYLGVTPHALQTLGIRLLSGRDFTASEGRLRSSVAIVNLVFAKQFFQGRADIVGQRFRFLDNPQPEWLTIIGLVGDITLWSVRDNEPAPFVFVPYPYMPVPNTGLTIRVSGGPPAAITSLVREEIRKSDPLLAMFNARTGEENRALTYWQERLFGWMFSIFGGVALLLAAIGIYGVLSYSVAQRTQEIGVRMALGAEAQSVQHMIVGQGMRIALLGVGLGLVSAFGLTRIIASFLFGVTTRDPLVFVAVPLLLSGVALVGVWLPARRASQIDPAEALRAE
jgi:predicted permease